MTQVRLAKKKAKGRRYNSNDKATALALYHSSPKTYRVLRKLFLLPTTRTLRKHMQQVYIYPGFANSILSALRIKAEGMESDTKLCSLVMDEMAIKERIQYNAGRDEVEGFEDFGLLGKRTYVANHALVFMVRGLTVKWKQPIGYFLSSGPVGGETLTKLLLEAIDKITDIGLEVKIVLSDQGSNNRKSLETILKVSVDQPFFFHKNSKIFVMYDPPHLIKNIRNNLKRHGFKVDDKLVSWYYVREFYKADSSSPLRLAPKLKKKHIDLPPFGALSVKRATQVLSHSVAAGMHAMVKWGVIAQEAAHTATFIEHFDQLFNAFNSCRLGSKAVMRHALSETSGHKDFLTNSQAWLSTIKSVNGRKLPCLEGWKMAINCLLQLWDHLHQEHGLKFLLTNRLNQDCIENLFSVLRGKGENDDHPDARQFRAAFRQVTVDAIMAPSQLSNCQEDVDQFLLTLGNIEGVPKPPAQPPNPSAEEDVPQADLPWSSSSTQNSSTQNSSTQNLSVSDTNIVAYISGYIVSKRRDKFCPACREQLLCNINDSKPSQLFLSLKQHKAAKKGLFAPSSELQKLLQDLECAYRTVYSKILHMSCVRVRLVRHLMEVAHKGAVKCSCNQCDPKDIIVGLFANIRLHHSLAEATENLTSHKSRKNRKLLKFSHQ